MIGVGQSMRLSSARIGQASPSHCARAMPSLPVLQDPLIPSELRLPVGQEESMFDRLDRRDRLRLVEFVCSFAWADLEIQPEERVFIARLIRRLDLDAEEDRQVQQWLERPPRIDDLDPTSIPPPIAASSSKRSRA